MSITLNKLINHLENLKEYFGDGEIPVTVPVMEEDGETIIFIKVEELADINIYDFDVEGVKQNGLYIDVLQVLEEVDE